jgi:hypothetical protein
MEGNKYYDVDVARVQSDFIAKVFRWMSLALFVTAAVAMFVASNDTILYTIYSNKVVFWSLLLGELGLVFWLSSQINKISAVTATIGFFAYAAINGVTLSYVFVAYTASSIAYTFGVTAGVFALMAIYGYVTKKDLTSIGSLCFMALIGVIATSLINMFIGSSFIASVINYIGVFVFVGLTAYDTQKIKSMCSVGCEGTEEGHKASIMGALALYLDFINIFVYLLRIFGSRD